MEDDLPKKNGRRHPKKNGRRPQNKKIEDNLKKIKNGKRPTKKEEEKMTTTNKKTVLNSC